MTPTDPPAAVHVDLDGASAIYAMHGWSYPYDTDPLFETGLENLLAMLEELDIRATLFVIANDLDNPRKRALVEKAAAQGHEIASHSCTHRRLTRLSREERIHEIGASRERLSAALGVAVDGFRAPYFDIDGETLLLVAEAGYRYDSSYFPKTRIAAGGEVMETGVVPAPPWPTRPLVELPLPAYSPLPFPFHGSYSLVFGAWYFRLGLALFRRSNAPLVLLLHLTDLADPLPAGMLGGWQRRFFTLSYLDGERKRRRCADMLRHVARRYRLVDTSTLLLETLATAGVP